MGFWIFQHTKKRNKQSKVNKNKVNNKTFLKKHA